IHERERPVPVPSSKKCDLGLEAISVLNNVPTYRSEDMAKPTSLDLVSISALWVGLFITLKSIISFFLCLPGRIKIYIPYFNRISDTDAPEGIIGNTLSSFSTLTSRK